ncbi:MAG: UvrD-helicase domain-containing protein [Magnetococcales bacterium]|nr:UvrD-helicase domain-containing protein [Magnetococcales bacterium]
MDRFSASPFPPPPSGASSGSSLLRELNPPQKEAVTTIQGPVMVLAGAGSGKTRVLTRRLAYLLESGAAAPGEILAVTFTNKAAREMRGRVGELLGMDEAQARRLWIGTFHGMSVRILRQHADALGFRPDFTILDAADQERMVKKVLEEAKSANPFWTPSKLMNQFSRFKDDGLGPDDLGIEQFRRREELDWVSGIFRQYQEAMRQRNLMDFGDLLRFCLLLWRQQPEIMSHWQHKFRHLLVDEYQDTNRSQYEWLKLLAAGHGNLCVVGDDDQSIYSWRGARLDNILRFEEDFPGVRVVRLEQNYRSTGTILSAAGGLIHHNRGRMGKKLWTEGIKGEPLELFVAEDGEDEARFVAGEIRKLCPGGEYDRVAVLVRASRQTRELEAAFNHHGIPYRVVGGLKFMERAEVKDAVAYLSLAVTLNNDLALERIVNVPKRGLGDSALEAMRQAAEGGNLFLGAQRMAASGKGVRGTAPRQALLAFVQMIEEAHKRLTADPPEAAYLVLSYLLHESRYLEFLQTEEKGAERLENLRELGTLLARERDLGEFLDSVALEPDAGGRTQEQGPDEVRSVISTLHAAKGLEFPVVFLVGLEENLLPHKYSVDQGDVEEERRLAYVGMTRAREKLYLVCARRRRMFNTYEANVPSRFLKEIPPELVKTRGGQRMGLRLGVGEHVRRRY